MAKPEPVIQIINGRWYDMDSHERLICCDCGLTHEVDFRLNPSGRIQFKWKVNKSRTKRERRKEGIKMVKRTAAQWNAARLKA